MNDKVDIITGVIFAPTETFRKLSERNYLGLALLIAVFSQLPAMLLSPILMPEVEYNLTAPAVAQNILLSLGSIFVFGGLFHISCKVLGGEGQYLKLVQTFGFATLPRLLLAAFIPLSYTNMMGEGVISALNFASTGTMIWWLILTIVAIRETYEFTTMRTLGSVLVLFGIIIVLYMVVIAVLSVVYPEILPEMPDMTGMGNG